MGSMSKKMAVFKRDNIGSHRHKILKAAGDNLNENVDFRKANTGNSSLGRTRSMGTIGAILTEVSIKQKNFIMVYFSILFDFEYTRFDFHLAWGIIRNIAIVKIDQNRLLILLYFFLIDKTILNKIYVSLIRIFYRTQIIMCSATSGIVENT